jgi:hypothetical protein
MSQPDILVNFPPTVFLFPPGSNLANLYMYLEGYITVSQSNGFTTNGGSILQAYAVNVSGKPGVMVVEMLNFPGNKIKGNTSFGGTLSLPLYDNRLLQVQGIRGGLQFIQGPNKGTGVQVQPLLYNKNLRIHAPQASGTTHKTINTQSKNYPHSNSFKK